MSVATPIRLAAVASAPVFYQAPLYRRLAADPRIDLTVIYASSGGVRPYDAGFGREAIEWDEDLLMGYRSEFVDRADTNEVVDGFFGMRDWDIVRRLWHGGYDAVWIHGFSYLSLWLAIATAWLRRKPLLIREEQTLLHRRSAPKRWVRSLVLRTLFTRSFGLFIGSNNRDYFRHYGMADDRLYFAPYTVDNVALRRHAAELASERADVRAVFGIEGSDPVIVFVGKLIAKKRPLVLLDAFARLRTRHPCSLLVVGDGPLRETMSAKIADEGIPDVHFGGFVNRSKIAAAYVAADVFVLPSAEHETWGLVVNEAMNFGLPVVVSDKVGCARDLVRSGENGAVFRADDAVSLASALEPFVIDEECRRRAGRLGMSLLEDWTYEVAADGVVRACLAAAAQRRRKGTRS